MATSADIQNWFRQNPNATEAQIYAVMRQNNVTPEAVHQAMGGNLAGYQERYNAAQAEATPTGLVGYEQAAQRGLTDATSQLQSTLANINNLYGININDLQNAATGARGDINKGYGGVTSSRSTKAVRRPINSSWLYQVHSVRMHSTLPVKSHPTRSFFLNRA